MQKIFIYGASGHGLVVADIAKACGYEEIIFIDDGDNPYPDFDEIKYQTDIPVALGIGNNYIRQKIYEKLLNNNFDIITLIHPSATIASSVTVGKGTVIMPHVIINAQSRIGEGVILNSGCIIEHENHIGDFVHVSPGVSCAGDVTIGAHAHIGIGSNVIQGISIGADSIVGAGSVVVRNIPDRKVAYGNPCKIIKDIK